MIYKEKEDAMGVEEVARLLMSLKGAPRVSMLV